MAEASSGAPHPLDDDIKVAWDIHKDADNLLHNRMNAFLVVEALMFGAYFVVIGLSEASGIAKLYYQGVIFLAAIAISWGYWYLSQRMIRGILFLKNEYLLEHMPVYNQYYWALERHRQSPVPAGADVKNYKLHQVTPWVFVALWGLLFALAVAPPIVAIVTALKHHP